jgi:hypothetical protein
MARWIVGFIAAAFGLLGLFVAAYAKDGAMYVMGLLVFGFAVLFNFLQIKNAIPGKR